MIRCNVCLDQRIDGDFRLHLLDVKRQLVVGHGVAVGKGPAAFRQGGRKLAGVDLEQTGRIDGLGPKPLGHVDHHNALLP